MPSNRSVSTSQIALGLIALLGLAGCGLEKPDHPVRAELIASVDSVRAGEPFIAGVLLTIEPEWHVYWKYSGDAGLPTEIDWKLPEGWSVGELQWPLPSKFVENGPLTTYGYLDSVLLLAEVWPPDKLDTGAAISLSVQVDWMVCHEECVPGKATVALKLTPATGSAAIARTESLAQARIQSWLDRLPEGSNGSGWIVQAESSPCNNPQTVDARLNIMHPPDLPLASVEWFPAPSSDLLVKNVNVATLGGTTVIVFSLQSMFGPIDLKKTFESLLVYRDASNRERGVKIVTPLAITPIS